MNVPRGVVRSAKAKFEVFFIDYGTQEFVAYSRLRPSDCYSLPSSPGLAKLCSLAHIKVPGWEENYGKEAACRLSDHILHGKKFKAIVEEKDTSDGEVTRHGTGTNLIVTLMDSEANISINALMLKVFIMCTLICHVPYYRCCVYLLHTSHISDRYALLACSCLGLPVTSGFQI